MGRLAAALRSAVSGDVLEGADCLPYSVDSSGHSAVPRAVVVAGCEGDAEEAVRVAAEHGTSVTVRGAGTGLAGGALNSGIILDMRRLCHVRCEGGVVAAGAGATRGVLDGVLAAAGRFFAPNPSVGPFCTVGGMVGCNAGGSRSLKYGTVIDNLEEVTFVDGRARRITLPRDSGVGADVLRLARAAGAGSFPRVSKNSCGYRADRVRGIADSHRIIAGSEGTLGIVLSARLRTRRLPRSRRLSVLRYATPAHAAADCAAIRRTRPSALEFVGEEVARRIGGGLGRGGGCLLFVEHDCGGSPGPAASGAVAASAEGERGVARLWRHRDMALHHSLRGAGGGGGPQGMEDAAVPRAMLGGLLGLLGGMGGAVTYGHAGDANIHARLAAEPAGGMGAAEARYFGRVLAMGGTITAEHGDGIARSAFVRAQYGAATYAAFGRIKGYFDPRNVLNPGKIVAPPGHPPISGAHAGTNAPRSRGRSAAHRRGR